MISDMKIYDISMEIDVDMTVYKNKDEKKPELIVTRDFESGDIHESKIIMDLHTGTHMDAPFHVLENGETIENHDLYKTITKCKVLDFTNVENSISSEDLSKKKIEKGDFILLKTSNSFDKVFNYNFVYLDIKGAEFLKEKGVKGVGIDALGIERNQSKHETHKILLGNHIPIIEGLVLRDVEEGIYTLIALPLKINGVEASPLRAVLVK